MFGGPRHGVLSDPQKTSMLKNATKTAGLSKFVSCHAYKIFVSRSGYAANATNCFDVWSSKACNYKRIVNY